MEPDARFEHLTYQAILAHKDAALGIFGGVARMDADALPLLVEITEIINKRQL